MAQHRSDSREKLRNLSDFLADEILEMSDDEVNDALQDMRIDDRNATTMVENALADARREVMKRRFTESRATVKQTSRLAVIKGTDPARARRMVSEYFARTPSAAPLHNTLAARKGEAMTDETALEIYESLMELGAIEIDKESE